MELGKRKRVVVGHQGISPRNRLVPVPLVLQPTNEVEADLMRFQKVCFLIGNQYDARFSIPPAQGRWAERFFPWIDGFADAEILKSESGLWSEIAGPGEPDRKPKDPTKPMEWTRSETIALALPACTLCGGSGLRLDRWKESQPCKCVLRAIFRACYARFQQCTMEKRFSQARLEYSPRANRRITWGERTRSIALISGC